jgi:hypothetical protein
MCTETTIQELLAPYQEQKLDRSEQRIVKEHIASCEDCRLELSLISMMMAEQVPDPGDAFWTAMSGRVYHAVQERQREQKTFGIAWLLDRVALPRWALASATMATVLMLSWLLIRPVPEMVPSRVYELADEIMPGHQVPVAELDSDELITLDTWAGAALVSIAKEAEQAIGTIRDSDIYDDVAELNADEIEQLLEMINQQVKEVSS